MKYPMGALTLLALQNMYENGLLSDRSSGEFHIPDIPENERIRVFTPKVKKHATKRRRNKLHDRGNKWKN